MAQPLVPLMQAQGGQAGEVDDAGYKTSSGAKATSRALSV